LLLLLITGTIIDYKQLYSLVTFMNIIPPTPSSKAVESMEWVIPGILAPLYHKASDEILLHVFKFASQNASTLLALDRTCRRFHR
jgi:hypothetical protein